jgi:hypothetical protein
MALLGPCVMSDLSPQSGAKRTFDQVVVTNRNCMSTRPKLMPGSARQLRLRPAAVAFALGETVELQDDVAGQ